MTRGLIPGGHCPSGSPYVRLFPPVLLAAWGKPLAWIPCHLCACSLNRPSPMPSPVSPTAVLASIPRRPSTVYSTSLVSGLQDRVPVHCHEKASAHEQSTEMSMCMPLTRALFRTHTHTHTHVHAPVHKHTYTPMYMHLTTCSHTQVHTRASTCAQALSVFLRRTYTDMDRQMPMCCTYPETHECTCELCVGHQRDRPGVTQWGPDYLPEVDDKDLHSARWSPVSVAGLAAAQTWTCTGTGAHLGFAGLEQNQSCH